ncbi:MAG: ABC transporter ATP-binding protein/permease [Oscillospiraceae bacterium]|nr:ABC transporter ATP-binding protein/permease [Oscillospiraceae bacterium]
MAVTVPFDLTNSGEFCRGVLRWEGETLTASANGVEFFRRELGDAAELLRQTDIGCGRLEIKLKTADGSASEADGHISVCRFSMSCIEDVGEFCKVVNHWIKQGEATEIQEEDLRRCSKCGRNLLPGIRVCLFCTEKRAFWRRGWELVGAMRVPLLVSTLMMMALSLFRVVGPLLQRWLLDTVLVPGLKGAVLPFGWTPHKALLWAGLGMALSFVVCQMFLAGSNLLAKRSGSRFSDKLRRTVYDKVQNLTLSSMARRSGGDLMKRITRDTEELRNFINGMGRAVVEKTLMLLLVSGILLATNWKLALCVIPTVPLTLVVLRRFWETIIRVFERQWVCSSRETAVLRDIIKGIRVVKTFGTEAREVEKFSGASRRLTEASIHTERIWALMGPVRMLSMCLGDIMVVAIGGRMVLRGTMSLGELVQFTLFLGFLYEPLRWMCWFPRALAETTTSLIKIFEVLDEATIGGDEKDPLRAPIDGGIVFENVQFGYKSYEPVLREIALEIKPNEMVGLVGHSGAGKSTMINLMLRLYEANLGQVKISGNDIRCYDYNYLRDHIGVVFQETFLFSGTVYDNIAYAKPGAAFEEIMEASRMANAHEFIMKLPDGYNTVVGEDGHNLSGGERQRVAIARAVLKDPKILILDEATSALDPETESKIQQALDRLMKNRTTVVIAHRLSTLRNADRLVVLDQGRIAEQGSHRELLERKGIYYGLVMAQRQMQKRG